MVISSLMLEDAKPADLLSEDVAVSLRSLQTLLEDLEEEEKENPNKKNYAGIEGIKKLFYDDEDIYEEDDDEEEEYPVPEHQDAEKLREAAKAAPKKDRIEDEGLNGMQKINYEKVSATQKIAAAVHHNNTNYPTDRSFQSIVIESGSHTNVYNSLLNVAVAHGLEVEVKTYEKWGGGGHYIESINGVRNGDNGYFWEYIVNGKIPAVSVDKYQLHSGDLIEWRLLKKAGIKC